MDTVGMSMLPDQVRPCPAASAKGVGGDATFHSPWNTDADVASALDAAEQTLPSDAVEFERERLDRIERPSSRSATSAKNEEERLGHRSLRNSNSLSRLSLDVNQVYLNISGEASPTSAASVSKGVGSSSMSADLELVLEAGELAESKSSESTLASVAGVLALRPPGLDLRRMAHSLTTSGLGPGCWFI